MRKIFPMVLTSVSRKIVKPVLIASGIAVVFVSLWSFQQDNINSLEQKIDKLSVKIVKASSVDERLKLEKDILGFEKDKTIIQNGAYTNLVQALGGLVLSMTAWVGYQNFRVGEKNLKISEKNLRVSEDKQVTERFSKSIEHLGSDKIDIRLGGIYALEQIAIDSARYHWTIVEILSAFIREKCPLVDVASSDSNLIGVDIQAALTVLGRRKVEQDPSGKIIDLRNVKLSTVEINKSDLSGADLTFSILRKTILRETNLSEAFLIGADLSGAVLTEAVLTGAFLIRANLSEANLLRAKLIGTKLNGADLSGAVLTGANLIAANLSKANLSGADLSNIKVEQTIFRDNLGLSDDMKKELEGKGAIFEDSPGS